MSPLQEVLPLWPEICHGHVASREAQAGVRLETRQDAQLYSHMSGVYRVSLSQYISKQNDHLYYEGELPAL